MIAATRIESGATRGTRVPAIEILPDGQLIPAHPAQHARPIPFPPWPYFRRMTGENIMALPACIVISAAFHPDRNHVPR